MAAKTITAARSGAGPAALAPSRRSWATLLVGLGVLACLIWSYFPTIRDLVEFWWRNQDYSAGQLVPPMACYLAWRQHAALRAAGVRPSLWGLAAVALVECLRYASVYFGSATGERLALLLIVPAVTLLAAGWGVVRRLGWVFVFLALMLPLPARLHEAVSLPLQSFATWLAVFTLELLGFFVTREGNIFRVEDTTTIGVAEACSGLRMLTAFVFVSAVIVAVLARPKWEKALVLMASVPIAVVSNAIRSVSTALVIHYARNPTLGEQYHDIAGLLMMPLGVILALGLLRLFDWVRAEEPLPGGKTAARRPPASARARDDATRVARARP